jgi:dipeptide transport system permease protein
MPADVAQALPRAAPPGPLAEFWRAFRENRGAVIGLAIVAAITLIAIFAPFVAPHSPIEQFRGSVRIPPAWLDGGDWSFPLGTDAVGRDIFSRIVHGARISLFIGLSVMVVSAFVGVSLGLIAASFGGLVDILIIRVMDLIVAIPSLVLAILIIAVIGPNLANTIIAVTIVYLPRYVRLIRASALAELTKDYGRSAYRTPSSKPPPWVFSASAPSRPPRNGAPCSPMPASSSSPRGGSSLSRASPSW